NSEDITIDVIDTAGWQGVADLIDSQSQALGSEQTDMADLLLVCVEGDQSLDEREQAVLESKAPRALAITTKCDLAAAPANRLATSAVSGQGIDDLKRTLIEFAREHASPSLAPSLSRCRHLIESCIACLRQAHGIVLEEEPHEMLALELRSAL